VIRASYGGTTLIITDACVEAVVEAGYRPEFGARGLARAFQKLVLEPLALALKNDAKELVADVTQGKVTIRATDCT